MRAIRAVVATLVFAGLLWAQVPARYSAQKVQVRRVNEISTGDATRRPDKGELLEVRAVVTATVAGARLRVEQLKLKGTSKGAGKAAGWELSPTAVGATWQGKCAYEFPDRLTKGKVGFGSGPELWLKREAAGEPAVLEFPSQPIEFCAAFLVPAGTQGAVSLRMGDAVFPAPWQTD